MPESKPPKPGVQPGGQGIHAAGHDNTPENGVGAEQRPITIPPEQLEAFKSDLTYLYTKSVDLFGLPLDVLVQQVFHNAGQMGLNVNGRIVALPTGVHVIPYREQLGEWVQAYFDRVMPPQPAQHKPLDMPEA